MRGLVEFHKTRLLALRDELALLDRQIQLTEPDQERLHAWREQIDHVADISSL